MAYAGGYAGGYADTLVPPTPPAVSYGGGPPRIAEETRKLRSVLRWRLAIVTTGTVQQTDPEPLVVRMSTVALVARAAETVDLHFRADSSGRAALATRNIYRVRPGGTPIVIDPDEWIVFLP